MTTHTIKLNTENRTLRIIAVIILTACFYCLFSLVLSSYISSPGKLIIFANLLLSIIPAGYIAAIISGGDTTLDLENDLFKISSRYFYQRYPQITSIPVTTIRAYEIHQSKSAKLLVIYRRNQPFKTLPLKKINEADLQSLLSFMNTNGIASIKELGTLSSLTFGQAFIKSFLLLICSFVCFNLIYLTGFLFWYPEHNINDLTIPYAIAAFLVLRSFFGITRKEYRFEASTITTVFLGFTLFISVVLLRQNINVFISKPLIISDATQIKSHPNQKFFILENYFCDTTLTGYYWNSSTNSKSQKITINHFFASPVMTTEDDSSKLYHRYWVSSEYSHKIPKGENDYEKNKDRVTFMNQSVQEFNRSVSKVSPFYEVVYSTLNSNFRLRSFFNAAASTYKTEAPLIVMRPYSESFEIYRASVFSRGRLVITALITLFVLLAVLAAFKR